MAKKSGLGNQLYVAGYDISGDVGAVQTIAGPRTLFDVTAISKSAHERLITHAGGAISFNNWFNDAANQAHAALKGLPTTDVIATFLYSETRGDPAAGLVAKQLNYDWNRPADGGIQGTVELTANASPLEWGKSLTAGKDTHSSATSSTGIVDSAQTTAGARAYLEIFSLGSGTPTVKLEDSSDTTDGTDGSWADLVSFTINSANTAERVTVTGTVEKGVRVTTTGTFTNLVMAVVFVRGTANDDEDLS